MSTPPGAVANAAVLGCWLLGGGCWTAATFLPWASRGLLSESSLLDGARMASRGVVDVVPSYVGVLLLLPTVAGLVLIAVAGLRGRAAGRVRSVAGLVGTVAVPVLGWRIAGGDASRIGVGAALALTGVLLVVAAAIAPRLFSKSTRAGAARS